MKTILNIAILINLVMSVILALLDDFPQAAYQLLWAIFLQLLIIERNQG